MKKILIVDDSAFMRSILKNLFASRCEIVEAGDGSQALGKMAPEKPDLVLLDIVMPERSGTDVLKDIKKAYPQAKVIMITAVGQDKVIQECMELGASSYITKPFDGETVRMTVEKFLA